MPGAHAILILDGVGWHSSKDLVPLNISLLTLPLFSPDLKLVKNILQFLRQNRRNPPAGTACHYRGSGC